MVESHSVNRPLLYHSTPSLNTTCQKNVYHPPPHTGMGSRHHCCCCGQRLKPPKIAPKLSSTSCGVNECLDLGRGERSFIFLSSFLSSVRYSLQRQQQEFALQNARGYKEQKTASLSFSFRLLGTAKYLS